MTILDKDTKHTVLKLYIFAAMQKVAQKFGKQSIK